MSKELNYIDLFAGAGGLSEGFVRAGFNPVAHVESDLAACFTLKTRNAYHYLSKNNKKEIYADYLLGEINRKQLYSNISSEVDSSVINAEIGPGNKVITEQIDERLNGRKVDLIIGGPPCQAYSKVGRGPLKHKVNDERTTLYIHYGRFLKKYAPKVFVFENVPGIFTAGDGSFYNNLTKYYRRLGYNVEAKILNAYDYGVVQNRERVFIVGWRKDISFFYPEIEKCETAYSRDDIFNDLPEIKPGNNTRIQNYKSANNDYLAKFQIRNGFDFLCQNYTRPHNLNDLEIYKLAIQTLNEGTRLLNNQIPDDVRTQKNVTSFLDRFKVVAEKPHAMIAHIAKDGHHFIHPDKNQLRSISVREAARIQSFPDDYYFEGVKEDKGRTPSFKQIGNAVPPLLSEKFAIKINQLLNE